MLIHRRFGRRPKSDNRFAAAGGRDLPLRRLSPLEWNRMRSPAAPRGRPPRPPAAAEAPAVGVDFLSARDEAGRGAATGDLRARKIDLIWVVKMFYCGVSALAVRFRWRLLRML
ncbi:hypothetical protein EVAR_19590_1 [Eumeta japonica]|uniref:Uncharacterized protein n=1 Tax=Eumeta variegata TaxID=151549 RepID=A0A4C1UG33_EUMVA|nr:hypothetical protein EVAR_19590_1 [Eumeta japonica]